jgi:hypothetical protein
VNFLSAQSSFDPAAVAGIAFQTPSQKGFILKYANIQTFKASDDSRYTSWSCEFRPVKNSQFVAIGQAVNFVGSSAFSFPFSLPVFETVYPFVEVPTYDQINLTFDHTVVVGTTINVKFTFGISYL